MGFLDNLKRANLWTFCYSGRGLYVTNNTTLGIVSKNICIALEFFFFFFLCFCFLFLFFADPNSESNITSFQMSISLTA